MPSSVNYINGVCVVGIQPRVLNVVEKYSAAELHSQVQLFELFKYMNIFQSKNSK